VGISSGFTRFVLTIRMRARREPGPVPLAIPELGRDPLRRRRPVRLEHAVLLELDRRRELVVPVHVGLRVALLLDELPDRTHRLRRLRVVGRVDLDPRLLLEQLQDPLGVLAVQRDVDAHGLLGARERDQGENRHKDVTHRYHHRIAKDTPSP